MKYEELGKGIIRRREKKSLALFIDGVGLDRATRRINRKVDMSALVRGISGGLTPAVARYYTLIPYEDDSRQRAFLDAVSRAGLTVIVKRLPPKGVNRQVSTDVEMAADMIAFALGRTDFSDLSEYKVSENLSSQLQKSSPVINPLLRNKAAKIQPAAAPQESVDSENDQTKLSAGNHKTNDEAVSIENRIITVVCPSRDLSYSIALAKSLGAGTTTADFGQFAGQDILKSASKWIDLSDSETIWKD